MAAIRSASRVRVVFATAALLIGPVLTGQAQAAQDATKMGDVAQPTISGGRAGLALPSPESQPIARAIPTAPQFGIDDQPDFERENADVDVQRGNSTVRYRPIKTVRLQDGALVAAGRVLLRYTPAVSAAERVDVHQGAAKSIGKSARSIRSMAADREVIQIGGSSSLDDALAAYRSDPRVLSAEPDYMAAYTDVPSDPLFSQQWALAKIGAPTAWSTTHGSASIYVADLDSGIFDEASTFPAPDGLRGHPDLRGKVALRADFSGSTCSTGPTDDCTNHGTLTAGVIGASSNNGVGVASIGYNTRLFNAKLGDGAASLSAAANAVVWATNNGARVINMSFGSAGACPSYFQDSVNYAWSSGVVLVAAAGNSSSSTSFNPANCEHVIAVASTGQSDALSSFSNFGSWVHLAAPGESILSTDYVGGYASVSGTSFSAPYVSGLAALVRAVSPDATALSLTQRIETTADPVPGTGVSWQFGRINAAAAVSVPAPCTAVMLNASPHSPQSPGTTVTLTATATACSSPQFLFWVKANGIWSVVQDWSTSAIFSWNTTSLAPGSYVVEADARAGTSGIWQAYGQLPYTLSASNTCTSVALNPSPASPQTAGTTVRSDARRV